MWVGYRFREVQAGAKINRYGCTYGITHKYRVQGTVTGMGAGMDRCMTKEAEELGLG